MFRSIALAGAVAAAAASPVSAASLKGKPFVIDKSTADQLANAGAYAGPGGEFGVSFATDTTGEEAPDTVWLQSFKASGKPDGKKALVAKGKDNQAKLIITVPAGALSLGGSKALVGYMDLRATGKQSAGGLFAQAMDDGKTSGKELEIDTETKLPVPAASLVALEKGGFGYWTTLDIKSGEAGFAGRFVSASGKPGKKTIDLTRAKSQFTGATPYLNGFIGQWIELDDAAEKATIYAQIFDGAGKRVGKATAVTDTLTNSEVAYTVALGLTDGDIVVLQATMAGETAQLAAQLYDKSWKTIGKPKVVVKSMVNQGFVAQRLPGGDFVVGTTVTDGAKDAALALTRFSQKLKAVGGTARIAGVDSPAFLQIVTLSTGDVLGLYNSEGRKLTGQLFKP